MSDSRQSHLILILSLLFWSVGVVDASEPEMGPELRESYRKLMDLLAPEPVINTGSDGVLTLLLEEDARLISEGRQVYLAQCGVCHGDNLQGQSGWEQPDSNGMMPAPPHDDSGHTWHHADDQLFEIVKYGPAIAMGDPQYRSAMPSFAGVLSDSEIIAVLVYIRSTWATDKRKWQRGANDAQTGNVWWHTEE